ncbi:MAG TPA: MBL fold metallo-hydrolase, partial [Candidatus Paceibacterota bacterium]|nr:MBL fold metallo-hydrolase [Candidatus Paceibacterota bacterium]
RQFLTVAFLDVGQGDAIFIEAPNGNQILIDAGQTSAVVRQLAKIIPFHDRRIDAIIATHHDSDHTGGFPEIFKRYKIEKYISGSSRIGDSLFHEIERLIDLEKSDSFLLSAGDRIILDSFANIYLNVLWPPPDETFSDTNEASVIVELVYDNVSFILTGDASKKAEEKIISAIFTEKNSTETSRKILFSSTPSSSTSSPIIILKAGHHGSKTSTSEFFVREIAPQFAIISAGKDNKFGHPHPEVVAVLDRYNAEILETAKMGTIIFKSDGQNVWLK